MIFEDGQKRTETTIFGLFRTLSDGIGLFFPSAIKLYKDKHIPLFCRLLGTSWGNYGAN